MNHLMPIAVAGLRVALTLGVGAGQPSIPNEYTVVER
jgi:hypothetical protein